MGIRLRHQDLARLYGDRFYLIPDAQAIPEESVPEQVSAAPEAEAGAQAAWLRSGKAVDWRMKEGAQICMVLQEEEFNDKNLTTSLKSYVTQAGISPKAVGFGMLEGNEGRWDFSDMPVPVAVVFGGVVFPEGPPPSASLSLDDKALFFAPSLTTLIRDHQAQEEVVALLQQAKFLMQP